MYTFYLNSDNSLIGRITDEGKLLIGSNHSNIRNSQRLVSNITDVASLSLKGNEYTVSLNQVPYVKINKKNSNILTINSLTSFETRLFAQGQKRESLPFQRMQKTPTQLKTDLHTHFAGALPPDKLIQCGIGKNIKFSNELLEIAQIDVSTLTPDEKGNYLLDDIIRTPRNQRLLINAMKIDTSEQETFNKMESIYAMRGPITKSSATFIPILEAIAKDAQQNGVKYLELSLSSVISDVSQIKLLEQFMPNIEKSTGVKIRFLGALWRHSDKEWNQDEVDRLQVMAQSPYVVGCDFMGHETNSTKEFYNNIKDLAKYAMQKDPDFVIRVHAGENPLFKANARDVLLAVEEAHHELSQSTKNVSFPQVRLGHGIYGFNEPAPWDEAERTKNLSMLDLCKLINPVVEFNMSSNLSLNNINSLKEIPIKNYLDAGIQVVLGTDGRGIYSTDLKQEMILAHEAGLTIEDFKKIEKTENEIINKADRRFAEHKNFKVEKFKNQFTTCYRNGIPCYNQSVAQRKRQEYLGVQEFLSNSISHSGAVTDLNEVNKAIAGKKPVMITGSSHKHWPQISTENQSRIELVLDVLTKCLNPKTSYLVTGGTNHGVEKIAHKYANSLNQQNPDNALVVLGTLTEEAALTETNSIEANTITHAIIPTLHGKPAQRWFDLPDTVLQHLGEKDGQLIAIAGGSIVSDIIQRAHNMGLNIHLMSDVEGASGDKSKSLLGNDYAFNSAKDLIMGLMKSAPELIRPDVNFKNLDEIITAAIKEIEAKRQSVNQTYNPNLAQNVNLETTNINTQIIDNNSDTLEL